MTVVLENACGGGKIPSEADKKAEQTKTIRKRYNNNKKAKKIKKLKQQQQIIIFPAFALKLAFKATQNSRASSQHNK